jgi:acyl-CoA synthetase (NDP forming)
METLQKFGFDGRIAPVHPSNETVLGIPCHRSISEIPGHVDVAAFCVDAKALPDLVAEACAKGIKAGVVYGAIRDLQIKTKVIEVARQHAMALCGPNCMGILNPATNNTLYLQVLADRSRLSGNVALITQSGAVAVGMTGDCRRFGFSHIVSSGDEAFVTLDEYMEYFIDDAATEVIALFIESVRNLDGFTAALDRAARAGKPVVALKIGRSVAARAAVIGHTGGISGDGRIFSALMSRHGGIEVSSLEEMTEVLACCQSKRRPAGPRVGVVTASGGHVEMILDEAAGANFELPPLDESQKAAAATVIGPISGPGNPLDAWGTGDYQKSLAHGLDVIAAHAQIDSVVLVSDTNDGQSMMPTRYTDLLGEASLRWDKPFYFLNTRSNLMRQETVDKFRGTGVGMLTGVRQGLGSLGRMGQWARRQPALNLPPINTAAAKHELIAALEMPRRTINEVDAKRMLKQLELAVVEDVIVKNLAEAQEAASRLGYPVVLKVASDEIPHRSEFGLVAVGLKDKAALASAFADQQHKVTKLGFDPASVHHVVQPLAPAGLEAIIGVGHDPELGQYIVFGAGGLLVELISNVAIRPLPLMHGDAQAMVGSGQFGALLKGYRGRPSSDVAALIVAIERIADFAYSNRDRIREIDINPVFVGEVGRGCVIADALIVPA